MTLSSMFLMCCSTRAEFVGERERTREQEREREREREKEGIVEVKFIKSL